MLFSYDMYSAAGTKIIASLVQSDGWYLYSMNVTRLISFKVVSPAMILATAD